MWILFRGWTPSEVFLIGVFGTFLINIFRIALVNDQGLPLGWQDENITISGESSFAAISSHVMVKDGEEFPPGGGTRYDPGQSPLLKFTLKNTSSRELNFMPQIKL